MGIKTIPLNRLEETLLATLSECADSGDAMLVELPDHRLLAIQPVPAGADDALIDNLIAKNSEFLQLLKRSPGSPAKPLDPVAWSP